jgi:YgiT-type zinc finger domain-containing protein
MICAVCKLGETHPGETTLLLERKTSIIIIKDVPVHICENCGEKYFDSKVTREVLQKAEAAVEKGAELEILRMVA